MSKSSTTKGKDAEREFCKILGKLIGVDVLERNIEQCRSGGYDVRVKDGKNEDDKELIQRLDKFAIEIKRYSKCRPNDIKRWWQQAVEQAYRYNKIPMLAYRLNREPWHCMVHVGRSNVKEVNGCVTMDITLFADFLENGEIYGLSPS